MRVLFGYFFLIGNFVLIGVWLGHEDQRTNTLQHIFENYWVTSSYYINYSTLNCSHNIIITVFVILGLFQHFETVTNIRTWIKITQILENVVGCKYFEASVHIKNPIKNSCQYGLGRTIQTLDHVVVVHILI